MIKNSVRRKQREWEWQHCAVPAELSEPPAFTGRKITAVWRCRKYSVLVWQFPDDTAHLMINDPTCRHSWQDMMRIKNDVLGEDWAAVEVYPPKSLVVDAANMYHLWCTRRQLRIGWDDDGEYTVEHTFYSSNRGCKGDHALSEVGAAGLLKGDTTIIQSTLEGNERLATTSGADGTMSPISLTGSTVSCCPSG